MDREKKREILKMIYEERERVEKIYEEYSKIKGKDKEKDRENYYNQVVNSYFKPRIQRIEHGLKNSKEDIEQKIFGEGGLIRNLFSKDEEVRHGALGELEFLERKILIDEIDVEILVEEENAKTKQGENKKNPDYKLIFKVGKEELVTEVKSPTGPDEKTISYLIKNANKKFKKSDLKTYETLSDEFYKIPDRAQGALEIQYFDKYAATLDKFSLDQIEQQVRKAFNKNSNRGIVQVRIYREHELFLEYTRDPQNEIKRTFPDKDLEKEVAAHHELDGSKFQTNEMNQMAEVPHNRVSHLHELGKQSDIAIVKLNLTDTEELNLTCKYHTFEKEGQKYIAVHKNDRENESLKQLLGQNKEKNHVAKQDEPGEDFGER